MFTLLVHRVSILLNLYFWVSWTCTVAQSWSCKSSSFLSLVEAKLHTRWQKKTLIDIIVPIDVNNRVLNRFCNLNSDETPSDDCNHMFPIIVIQSSRCASQTFSDQTFYIQFFWDTMLTSRLQSNIVRNLFSALCHVAFVTKVRMNKELRSPLFLFEDYLTLEICMFSILFYRIFLRCGH